MNSQFEFHFPAHRCLAKDGFDVEQAQPAHLKQILKKRRAAPFNEIRTEQRKIDGVIRDEAVAAADQFKPQLAFAKTGFARKQNPHAENIEKHARSEPTNGKSTASSATRPWPRLINSSPSSPLPRPDSPASRTPMPRISRNTPCRVVRGAKMREI